MHSCSVIPRYPTIGNCKKWWILILHKSLPQSALSKSGLQLPVEETSVWKHQGSPWTCSCINSATKAIIIIMCDAVSYSSWYPTASPVLTTFFIYSKVPCSEYMHAWAAADWTRTGLPQSFFSDTSQSVARQAVAYKTKRPKEISPTFIMEKNLVAAIRCIVYYSWFPLHKWTLYCITSDYMHHSS